MLHYIRDKTAVPYFSNLVWFIGSHVIELDKCVQTDQEHRNRGKLSDLVAEHLDHLHYLNDILTINCEFLNDVLTDHLLNRLFLPLYVFSLVCPEQSEDRKINPQVSLNLLSQVSAGVRRFTKPPESLERSLELSCNRGRKRAQKRPNYKNLGEEEEEEERPGGGREEGLEDGEREKAPGQDNYISHHHPGITYPAASAAVALFSKTVSAGVARFTQASRVYGASLELYLQSGAKGDRRSPETETSPNYKNLGRGGGGGGRGRGRKRGGLGGWREERKLQVRRECKGIGRTSGESGSGGPGMPSHSVNAGHHWYHGYNGHYHSPHGYACVYPGSMVTPSIIL
ncbi:unnamed protein product [Coregonus sp. 'balchen']|nr:unnamed protein product [Coregonus sp. 'balchen']